MAGSRSRIDTFGTVLFAILLTNVRCVCAATQVFPGDGGIGTSADAAASDAQVEPRFDGGDLDGSLVDGGRYDAGVFDASVADAGTADGGETDASFADASTVDAGCQMDASCAPTNLRLCFVPGSDCSAYFCSDTDIDPDNCGACGNVCCPGENCFLGKCTPVVPFCQTGQTPCGATSDAGCFISTPICVNLRNDPNHCGGCAIQCPAGQACTAGCCSPCDVVGTIGCDPTDAGCPTVCVNPKSDPMNCGGCGVRCCIGNACVGGTCVLQCASGLVACSTGIDAGCVDNALCVDPNTDPQNCGGCGSRCVVGSPCLNGTCLLADAGAPDGA